MTFRTAIRAAAAAIPMLLIGFTIGSVAGIAGEITDAGAAPVSVPHELWRIGGENEDEGQLFGRVESVLIDDAGRIYILDVQLGELRVFSPDGQYLHSLGREGEGPGEFGNPVTQFLLPDDRIGIMQVMPTRIAVVGLDGTARDDLEFAIENVSATAIFQEVRTRENRIYASYTSPTPTDRGIEIVRALVVLDADGSNPVFLKRTATVNPPGQPVRVRAGEGEDDYFRGWTVGAGGRVYVAPGHIGYRIHVLDPAGGEERVIEREYASLKRADEEIARMREEQRSFEEKYGLEPTDTAINPFEPDIVRIVARDDGQLWVLTSRGQNERPDDSLGVFDVFDAGGRFVGTHTIMADFDPEYDDFQIVRDRLFVLKEANAASDVVRSASSGGMSSTMIRRGGTRQQDDDHEPRPFEIICYDLPLTRSS